MSICDFVATFMWDRTCDNLQDGFPVDSSGTRYVEQEEEAPAQEEEGGDTQKRPPAKASGTGGDTRLGKKTKAQYQWHSHAVHPPALSKTRGQQGNECLCCSFYPLPRDTSIPCCC